nr:cadherin-like domain-containing protein [Chloroflexota bacterium]
MSNPVDLKNVIFSRMTSRFGILALAAVTAIMLTLTLLPGSAEATHDTGFVYTLNYGNGQSKVITPLVGSQSVVDFYNYTNAGANTGLEVADRSRVFLYQDTPGGKTSLVFIHNDDVPGATGDNGEANFTISGLPAGTVVAVADDNANELFLTGSGGATGDWAWNQTKADGGALEFDDNLGFNISVSLDSYTSVNRWQWLSGNISSPSVTNMNRTLPISITTNQKPQGHDDTADTIEDISVDIDVLTNDTDVEGSPLAVTSVGNGANGTTSINANGTISYTPNADFAGTDVFTYTVSEYLPQSCGDILDLNPSAVDGTYTIYPDSHNFDIYCHDMASGSPLEYLTLAKTTANDNFSLYPVGGASTGTTVRTDYTKLRLDTDNLVVDTGDQTFSASSGLISHSANTRPGVPVSSMPLGVAMSCIGGYDSSGQANINLRGTSFKIDDTFTLAGWKAAGSAAFSGTKREVDVTGGGYCASNSVTGTPTPRYNDNGDFILDLAFIGAAAPALVSSTAQVTVTIEPAALTDVQPDDADTIEGSAVDIDVLANDLNADETQLTILDYTDGANGTVTTNPDGTLNYSPNPGFSGDDTFEYTVAEFLPETCQDIRDADGTAGDGDYTINPNGNQFTVYCHDMGETPTEFLTLSRTLSGRNYGQYTAGGASTRGADGVAGTAVNVRTYYTKVRIDPFGLRLHTGDQTFASSTGGLYNSSGSLFVSSMPLGTAMACIQGGSDGRANINLRGLPFYVDDTFTLGGAWASGTAAFTYNNQRVQITGGGYCGHNSPTGSRYNPTNTRGNFSLDIAFTGPSAPAQISATVQVNVTVSLAGPTDINLSTNSVDENSAAGTVVGNLSVTDLTPGDIHTLELLVDGDGQFEIIGTQLVVASGADLDFETATSHDVTIKATDLGLLTFEKDFTINVDGINEDPTDIVLSGNSVPENSAFGVVIGNLSTSDPDVGDVHSFHVLDNDGGPFGITIGQNDIPQLVVWLNPDLDFETDDEYNVTIRVEDQGVPPIDEDTGDGYEAPLFYHEVFTIDVTDVDESPTASFPAGDPAYVLIGGTVQLDGDGSDPESDLADLAFSWDLNGDGYFESPGQSVDFDASIIEDPILAGGDPSDTLVDVTLRVCDPGNNCDTAVTTVELALETVTNNDSSGIGSLRQAIGDLYNRPGGTIRFAPNVTRVILVGGSSNINIYQDLIIEGPGSDVLTIEGSSTYPVIQIAVNLEVAISGLSITHSGTGATAGLTNPSTTTLTDVSVTGFGAYGIKNFNTGTLTINDSEVSDNGHVWVNNNQGFAQFAVGIINESTLILNNVTVNDNAVDGVLNSGKLGIVGGVPVYTGGVLEISGGSMSGN